MLSKVQVCEFDIILVLYLRSTLPMEERDRDNSSGIGSWEHAFKGVFSLEYGADGLGAATKLNKQVLSSTKARPYEADLLTARDRPFVWADLLKGRRREGLSSKLGRFSACLMRNRGSM